jgi:hypothetical protein
VQLRARVDAQLKVREPEITPFNEEIENNDSKFPKNDRPTIQSSLVGRTMEDKNGRTAKDDQP